MAEHVPAILGQLDMATKRIDAAAANVNEILGDKNRKTVEAALQNVATASADFSKLSVELKNSGRQVGHLVTTIDDLVSDNKVDIEKAVVDLRFILGSVSRLVEATNQNLEATAHNMYEFSRQIRQNPSLLLRGGNAPDQAAAP